MGANGTLSVAKELYILKGVSGSGKSHLAQELVGSIFYLIYYYKNNASFDHYLLLV